MILDTLENADRYASLHPGFGAAFAFLKSGGWRTLPSGVREIDGRRLYVNMMTAPARPRAAMKLEYHRAYIDIQFVVAGTDEMGWRPTAACRAPEGPYSADKDIGFFRDAPSVWVGVPAGSFAVFFSEDAHAPMGGEGTIRKAVVKVAVAW